MNPDSKRFSVNRKDLTVLGKNAALVGLAASLTYIGSNVMDIDMGENSLLAIPVISFIIETCIKWLKTNETPT
jgi:hypothetical protein